VCHPVRHTLTQPVCGTRRTFFFLSLFLFLAGFDTYGVAKTGSGKTATFAIPILQRLAKDPFSVFALVLTPTRELAFQISEQFAALGKPIGLRQAVVVGGLDFVQQGVELSRRPHVVVATPGRLADHISGGADVPLRRLQLVVYDEADRLLENASFASDLATIAAALPAARQTLLFTATPLDPACDFFATLREPVHRCDKQPQLMHANSSTQARTCTRSCKHPIPFVAVGSRILDMLVEKITREGTLPAKLCVCVKNCVD
jgi:superfamily II DNA/RNA helicase